MSLKFLVLFDFHYIMLYTNVNQIIVHMSGFSIFENKSVLVKPIEFVIYLSKLCTSFDLKQSLASRYTIFKSF